MEKDRIGPLLNDFNFSVQPLNEIERNGVVISLMSRLCVNVEASAPWDAIDAPDGKKRSDGWELIPKYIGDAPCLVFSNGAKAIWRFDSGHNLLNFLKNSPAFEYYTCDINCEYLLCSNHHDYVIGWGKAKEWVDHIPGEI